MALGKDDITEKMAEGSDITQTGLAYKNQKSSPLREVWPGNKSNSRPELLSHSAPGDE